MRFLVLTVLLLVTIPSRAGMSLETWREEVAWQALNVVDTYTTLTIRHRYPYCAREGGAWRVVTGTRPDSGRVLLAAAIWSGAHFTVTKLLESNDAPRWTRRAWQAFGFTATGISVTLNAYHLSQMKDEYQTCEELWSAN